MYIIIHDIKCYCIVYSVHCTLYNIHSAISYIIIQHIVSIKHCSLFTASGFYNVGRIGYLPELG